MISTKKIANLAPRGQPASVHEIADRLFPAYKVDGGRVYLAGCTLDNRLFLQVTLRVAGGTSRFFLDGEGRRLDEDRAKELGLDDMQKLEKPPEPARADIARLTKIAILLARDEFGNEFDDVELGDDNQAEIPSKFEPAAIWCKFAQGKLRFTIGERSVDLPFADWAKTLAPPPYVCRYTGEKTFHLGTTSDGRIVAAERLETCQASGQRLLDVDMVTCAASGQRVSRELAQVCPVSDEHVLADRMVQCVECGEMVSPNAIQAERCAACRGVEKFRRDDPRRQRLLDAYPGLARRQSWKIAETAAVYILVGCRLFKRVLLVIDKETLRPKHLAVSRIFSPSWQAIDVSRIDEVLTNKKSVVEK